MELTYLSGGLIFAWIVEEWVWDYAIPVKLIHIDLTVAGKQQEIEARGEKSHCPRVHKCKLFWTNLTWLKPSKTCIWHIYSLVKSTDYYNYVSMDSPLPAVYFAFKSVSSTMLQRSLFLLCDINWCWYCIAVSPRTVMISGCLVLPVLYSNARFDNSKHINDSTWVYSPPEPHFSLDV